MAAPYPLTFEPMLLEKVWGGSRLARLGKRMGANARIGESWEIADLDGTSASGAGGGAMRSIIAEGPLAGRMLREALELWGERLIGAGHSKKRGARPARFPLLVKFLDAREHLSVQVHPSPAYAASHPGAYLKTECWYVVDADPDAVIFKGFIPGTTRADVEQALRTGEGEGLVRLLRSVPAVPGECHNLPSGAVHALGAGVLVAEVQTPSDTTFRVYDWAKEYGRTGRTLHVEEALACMDLGPAPEAMHGDGRRTSLARTEFFEIDEYRPEGQAMPLPPGCSVLMVLRGSMTLRGCGEDDRRYEAGTTVLVPAELSSAITAWGDVGAVILRAGLGS